MPLPTVLLCNPPSPTGETADREAAYGMGARRDGYAQAQPPHTLAWCAAMLADWSVAGLDAVVEGWSSEETLAAVKRQEPSILVLLVSPQTAEGDLEWVRTVRHHFPALPLLLVGLGTRFLPPALAQAADAVLLGEPERAIGEACHRLLERLQPGALSAHPLEGHVLPQPGSQDLNALPPPAWHHFPIGKYGWLPLASSRGCGHGCHHCPVPPTQGATLRTRLPERIAAEMDLLVTRFGVRRFRFLDPVFAANRSHAVALCRAIGQRGLAQKVTWSCETRPEAVDLLLLQHMARAGCRDLHLGLESVSPETLIALGRTPDARAAQEYLERVRQIVFGCQAMGIACHLHVLAGLPGDRAGAAATRTFLRAYLPHHVVATPLVPYPGTSIFPTHQLAEETRLLTADSLAGSSTPSPQRWFPTWLAPFPAPEV